MQAKKHTFSKIIPIFLFLLFTGIACVYTLSQPRVSILKSVTEYDTRYPGKEYYYERIMTTIATRDSIALSEKSNKALNELFDWCNGIDADLQKNYIAPLHISVDGMVKNGKKTFWYKGYATKKNGETVDFYEEKTFEYVFTSEKMLFN